jgi:hypothetical protein
VQYPDRVAQVAIIDAPWIFKVVWNLITKMLDPLMQTKAVMLRGQAMEEYFQNFLTPDQAEFANSMLKLQAAPNRESFAPCTSQVRRTLGPADAFTRESAMLDAPAVLDLSC